MYDLHSLSSDTVDWVFDEAMNELHAYLCEVDFRRIYGDGWPKLARATAVSCRAVADAATDKARKDAWLMLAENYEGTITELSA